MSEGRFETFFWDDKSYMHKRFGMGLKMTLKTIFLLWFVAGSDAPLSSSRRCSLRVGPGPE